MSAQPYLIALAVYALRSDAWGISPDEPGPSGWGAVLRKGGRVAEYRQHCCAGTRASVRTAALGLFEQMLTGQPFALVDAPGAIVTEQSRRDLERALQLARFAATIPHDPHVEVIA